MGKRRKDFEAGASSSAETGPADDFEFRSVHRAVVGINDCSGWANVLERHTRVCTRNYIDNKSWIYVIHGHNS